MAQILKLAQVNTDGISNLDLASNELVALTFMVGGASGTQLSKAVLDLLILQSHAPGSDNQNIIAGAGLTGGGAGATVTLNVVTADASITVAADAISVARDAAGAVGLSGTGLIINVDGVGLEINTNALRLKDLGVSTAKLADNAVTAIKLLSDPSVDANRAVNTNHIRDNAILASKIDPSVAGPGLVGGNGTPLAINADGASLEVATDVLQIKDGGVTNAKVATGIDAAKISGGSVSNTEFDFLNGVTSGIQGQLDLKVPTSRQVNTTAPLTGGGSLGSDLTIAIPAATTSVDGYLTATDWTTFNNKQPAGAYITALSGDVVATGPGSVAATVQPLAITTGKIANAAVDETKLAASVAGNGLSGGAGTALSVNVDGATLEINTDTLRIKDAGVTLVKLASLSVDENKLTASVAGNGLSGGAGSALSVNVDGATLEINADTLRIKDAGVTAAKLATGVADQLTITGGAGTALSVANSPQVKRTLVAGESFAANTSFLVRWALTGETAGRVYKADSASAASQGKFYAFGIAHSAAGVAAAGNIDVVSLGSHTLGSSDTPFAGADVGKALYLTTAGAWSITAPTASASAVFRIGVIRTTTQIDVGMQQLNGINP